MALVKYGGGVASMSGKLGGSVAARNRAGAYMRNWAKPTNTPTAIQTARRAQFQTVSAGWTALDDTNRDAWNAWASGLTMLNRQGDSYVPTGRQMYMSCNQNVLLCDGTMLDSPPTGATPPVIDPGTTAEVTETAGVLTLYGITGPGPVDGLYFIIQASPMQQAGRNNLTTQFRQVVFMPADAFMQIEGDYPTVFGSSAPLGARVQTKMRAVDRNTGLTSPWLIINSVVTT